MDMRRLTAAVFIAAFGCMQWALADDNLITNPGFEELDAETGFATAWEPTFWSNPHGEVTLSEEARNGEACAVVTGVPPAEIKDATPRNNNLLTQRIDPDVMGMRKLHLAFWFRCTDGGRVHCSMMTHDANGDQLQYISSRQHTDASEWTQLSLDITTDPLTAKLTVMLRNEGPGPAWYDDVSLTASDDVLEHDLARVHIEPFVGGRVRSFVVKDTNRDLTFWQGVRPGGMASDIVPGTEYPGLLRDSACEMKVLEPRRRVLVTHGPLPAPLDGLVIEKELSLREGVPVIDVAVRVTNKAAEERSIAYRVQQCLPPRDTTITLPLAGQVRVIRHDPLLAKWGLDINDLNAGWIACTDNEDGGTVLLQFDRDEVTKGYLYRNQDLQTVEWYYREVAIAPGAKWETSYSIAALPGTAPVVAAGSDLAIGLSPLTLGEAGRYSVEVSPLRASVEAHLSAKATGEGNLADVERDLTVTAGGVPAIELPWDAAGVRRIDLSARVGETDVAAALAPELLDASPLMDLPPPPERMAQFPAATSFFPYGEYYRGVVGAEAGNTYQQVARFLRAYRRCYMNAYMIGENSMLGDFRDNGTSRFADMIAAHRMRIIARADMMRRFERDENRRILTELPVPEPMTREVVLERIRGAGDYSLELRKQFLEMYGDLILAYDFADEPGGQYIPMYMLLQSIYREIDPDHPVLVILNLNRTEFLPFMPIYYGDEYPIHNDKRGGRNPWAVTKMVRFCATRTKAPVWVMLQAFGGLPDYTWQLPNEAEMRLTIYEAIANGCKGITFHGSNSPPCWRYNMHYFETAIDSWGVEEPGWSAMRDAGKWLTAIGPALLTTTVSDDEVLAVECEEIGTEESTYRGPSLKAGVLTRNAGGWFAVVVNQDIEQARAGTLTVNTDLAAPGNLLFDLYDLKAIGPAAQAVELVPGDGRIYFVGTQAQADAVIATVHHGHYDNLLPLYEIDAALAEANAGDITAAGELADAAAKAAQAGDFATAHGKIVDARARVPQVAAANAALAGLSEAHAMLSEIARVYRDNFEVVMPAEDRKTSPRNQIWKNERDPVMQGYVDETANAFCLRMKLEDRVYAGEAEQVAGEVAALIVTARRLHEEAIAYVRAQAQ